MRFVHFFSEAACKCSCSKSVRSTKQSDRQNYNSTKKEYSTHDHHHIVHLSFTNYPCKSHQHTADDNQYTRDEQYSIPCHIGL